MLEAEAADDEDFFHTLRDFVYKQIEKIHTVKKVKTVILEPYKELLRTHEGVPMLLSFLTPSHDEYAPSPTSSRAASGASSGAAAARSYAASIWSGELRTQSCSPGLHLCTSPLMALRWEQRATFVRMAAMSVAMYGASLLRSLAAVVPGRRVAAKRAL